MEKDRTKTAYWAERAAECETERFRIPDYMIDGIANYIVHGLEPGGFLHAVLSNNLVEAAVRADSNNVQNLPAYAMFLECCAPRGCWGSETVVGNWVAAGGLLGKEAA